MRDGPEWRVEHRCATSKELHAAWPEPQLRDRRIVAVCEPTFPVTVVLGSSQSDLEIDPVAAGNPGLAFARRSSGGGAVLVAPGGQTWIDVWLPRGDPLWEDDVIKASFWVGDAWLMALTSGGAAELSVHRGRLESSPYADRICFAGLGPGEVSSEGRKLVGLAQRRTRDGVRFHTVCPVDPVSRTLVPLLGLGGDEARLLGSVLDLRSTCLTQACSTRDTAHLADLVTAALIAV